MMKPYTCEPNSASSALTMHKDSQVISKLKPKVRIIHLFAPEIIKTDVSNFRELVQSLTGKPTDQRSRSKKTRTSCCKPRNQLRHSENRQKKIKNSEEEEEDMQEGENSSSFFGGFADLDCFIQGLMEFPLLPLNASSIDACGKEQLL